MVGHAPASPGRRGLQVLRRVRRGVPHRSIRDQLKVFAKYKNKRAALVPCRETCPAGIDVPRYVRFVKQGEGGAATAVVREKVPFPGTLGARLRSSLRA